MDYVTSREFSQAIHGMGLTNADATRDDLLNATVWKFPGEPRIAGEIVRDHNGTSHYLAEELVDKLGAFPCKFERNSWNTTGLTLNIMARVARLTKLDITDDRVSDELYQICYDLEDWDSDQGFGSSDSYGYMREAQRVFHIPQEAS